MDDEKGPSTLLRSVVAFGTILFAVGCLWWLWLTVTGNDQAVSFATRQREVPVEAVPSSATGQTAAATPTAVVPRQRELVGLFSMAEPVLFDDDMGTGSSEFSAVALNEETNRLMVADDEGLLFEFDLADDGVPITPPRRTIISQIDDNDIEGISWISGNTYVLAHETTGKLSVVAIDDGQTVINDRSVRRTIDTQLPAIGGNGIEGVSTVETIDDVEFMLAFERPPSLTLLDDDGAPATEIPLLIGIDDVADVWASTDGTVWIVSDANRVVVRLEIGPEAIVSQLQSIDLVLEQGRFEQPEGLVVSSDSSRLYVVGESPGPGQFSLGFWVLTPTDR